MNRITHIHAVIDDEMVSCYGGLRASILRPGDEESECPCGKIVLTEPTPNLVVAFCDAACYAEHVDRFLKVPYLAVSTKSEKVNRTIEDKYCEECSGKNRGGHADCCSQNPKVIAAAASAERRAARGNCPECDGPAGMRKGWKHTPECEYNKKQAAARSGREVVARDPCSECGGPAKGRGFSHIEGCSLKPQQVVREAKPPCSECGGPRRGKGYTHVEGCGLKPKGYVKTGKPRGRKKRRKMPAGM